MNAGFKIKRRDDLIPSAIGLKFRISGTWNGEQYTQVINDIAGTIGGAQYEGIGLTGALLTVQSIFTGRLRTAFATATAFSPWSPLPPFP